MKGIKFLFTLFCVVIAVVLSAQNQPIDGLFQEKTMTEKAVLPYKPLREADVMWSKRITRVIDTREKINLSFRYPEMPLYNILEDGIRSGEIQAYSGENDKFDTALDMETFDAMVMSADTIGVYDFETDNVTMQVVHSTLDVEEVVRYRIKEIWYFDTNESRMKVRILGIAPLLQMRDENGNFKYELPMFWVYYPQVRAYLANQPVFLEGTDNHVLSWEDIFEMRRFSSYINKESNVHDRKLKGYLAGTDLLLQGRLIHDGIFNKEQDMWAY